MVIDSSVGSHELARYFPKDVAEVSRVEFADFLWEGRGETGNVICCAERKTISDLIQCITDNRFIGDQVPKMVESSNVQYLIIEGEYRCNPSLACVQVRYKGHWLDYKTGSQYFDYHRLQAFITGLEEFTPLRVRYSVDERDTVKLLLSLEQWWSKEYESHSSHLGTHIPRERGYKGRMPLTAKIASQLPGVGFKKALWIAKNWRLSGLCTRIIDTINLKDAEGVWINIPGVGSQSSKTIINFLKRESK